MFGRTWRIGSIGGVAIGIDSSWLVIAALVTYSLWLRFTFVFPGIGNGRALALAILSAGLFFGSVLAHELAHAGVARARGIPVSGITLFLFGGATSARVEDKGPRAEFQVTVVGPLTSLTLAGLFWVVGRTLEETTPTVAGAFGYLAWVNFVLAVFNLVPGFPLDGGRILRSIIWRVSGSLQRATGISARVGQGVAALLIVAGIVAAIRGDAPAGLWLAAIGWFLLQAARTASQEQRLRALLAEGTVEEAMRPPPPAVPAEISLSDWLHSYAPGSEGQVFPVVEGERVVGTLTFSAARRVGRVDPLRPVREAMARLGEADVARPEEHLDRVSDRLPPGRTVLVLRDGQLVGSLTQRDVARWLRTRSAR